MFNPNHKASEYKVNFILLNSFSTWYRITIQGFFPVYLYWLCLESLTFYIRRKIKCLLESISIYSVLYFNFVYILLIFSTLPGLSRTFYNSFRHSLKSHFYLLVLTWVRCSLIFIYQQVAVILLLRCIIHSQNRKIFLDLAAIKKSKFKASIGLHPPAALNTTG